MAKRNNLNSHLTAMPSYRWVVQRYRAVVVRTSSASDRLWKEELCKVWVDPWYVLSKHF